MKQSHSLEEVGKQTHNLTTAADSHSRNQDSNNCENIRAAKQLELICEQLVLHIKPDYSPSAVSRTLIQPH